MENLILTSLAPEELSGMIQEAVRAAIRETQQKEPEEQILLSRKEAAEMLKISLVTLNDWSKRGLLKSYIIGGRVLYKSNEVVASLGEAKTVNWKSEKWR